MRICFAKAAGLARPFRFVRAYRYIAENSIPGQPLSHKTSKSEVGCSLGARGLEGQVVCWLCPLSDVHARGHAQQKPVQRLEANHGGESACQWAGLRKGTG